MLQALFICCGVHRFRPPLARGAALRELRVREIPFDDLRRRLPHDRARLERRRRPQAHQAEEERPDQLRVPAAARRPGSQAAVDERTGGRRQGPRGLGRRWKNPAACCAVRDKTGNAVVRG